MAKNLFIPAVIDFASMLASSISTIQGVSKASTATQQKLLENVSSLLDDASEKLSPLNLPEKQLQK